MQATRFQRKIDEAARSFSPADRMEIRNTIRTMCNCGIVDTGEKIVIPGYNYEAVYIPRLDAVSFYEIGEGPVE